MTGRQAGYRINDLLRVVMLAMVLGGTLSAAEAAGTLYSGPAADPAFTILIPRLLTALYPNQRLNATAVADDAAALDRVMADPTSAALVDLAAMTEFATAKKLAVDRLEFHGPLEQRCLLAFARRDGWVQNFSDIASAKGSPRPTVGLAGTGAASLLGIIRGIEPGLAGVDVQPGDAGPLAQQVEKGAPDLLLLAADAELDHDLIKRLADENRLIVLPVVSRLIARAAMDRSSGFVMEPVSTRHRPGALGPAKADHVVHTAWRGAARRRAASAARRGKQGHTRRRRSAAAIVGRPGRHRGDQYGARRP